MNWVKTNWWIRQLFPKYIWKIKNTENKVYLTFDDGPIPEVTEWTLDLLKAENIKATFFCIGENIQKHPEIFNRILAEGHSVGNHTFNHLNGWKNKTTDYLKNTELWEKETSSKFKIQNSKLFRPPYGKIKFSQARAIRKKEYRIIMWDIISYDFDSKITPKKCLENVVNNVAPGSIIVFHDSRKAETNLRYTLPKVISSLKAKAYSFDKIT